MNQKIIKGIRNITNDLVDKKFLLVKDSAYDFLNVKSFFDQFEHIEFSGFTSNPLYDQVCDGVDMFQKEKCEMIVAVGGGSAIDVAKCIKLFCKLNKSENYLQQEMMDTGIKLIALPTTAGTGSESTKHAVIYYKGVKQSISHNSIVPNIAVLEPEVLLTLPVYQKKCTLLDALCQAIESWWSVKSTEESIDYSRKAISAIDQYWKEYIFDNTLDSAAIIMNAANYAGRAINITATTAAHAMSYKITSLYGLPHGHSVAVCMPHVWRYNEEHIDLCIDDRGKEYLFNKMNEINQLLNVRQFEKMLRKLEIKNPIASDKEEIDVLAKSVNPERLSNNPVKLDVDVLRNIYERIVI